MWSIRQHRNKIRESQLCLLCFLLVTHTHPCMMVYDNITFMMQPPPHPAKITTLQTCTIFIFLLLSSSFYPPLFVCRNLGKSGLRVSCLGLGEFCAGKGWNIFLPVSTKSNKTNVSISSPVQAPGWHLDRRSLMRWELRCLPLFAWAILPKNTFSRIALAEGALHRKTPCFHYWPVSKNPSKLK